MADITATPGGGATITVSAVETAGLKALAAIHVPFLVKAERWFGKDVAPELADAKDFLKSLAAAPPEGSTLTVTAPQETALKGLLGAHVLDFQAVLAVVESPPIRALLTFATALL
jgi:hypothetical protein